MWRDLNTRIEAAARGRLADYERARQRRFVENDRRTRRSTGVVDLVSTGLPSAWSYPPFDPRHVLRRRQSIAHAIGAAMRGRAYVPLTPYGYTVPKRGGGSRRVSSLAIADEVVSLELFKAVLRKNRSRLSARSFAYRSDVGQQDAIRHLRATMCGAPRVYVAEYDLRNFFDSLDHDYLRGCISDLQLSLTSLEYSLLEAFMSCRHPEFGDWSDTGRARSRGIPQGTSASLVLANIATTPLDMQLEAMGLQFARYADDLIVWGSDYGAVSAAAHTIWTWATDAGIEVNSDKSPGVRLLVDARVAESEIRQTHECEFLSHSFTVGAAAPSAEALARIKAKVSRLLFDNLLREPLQGAQHLGRFTTTDRDYVTYIWQLRRYLYGARSESEVRRLSTGAIPFTRFTGAVSMFPYCTDHVKFHELDEWILNQTWLALRKRSSLLAKAVSPSPVPWNLSRLSLRECRVTSATTGHRLDLRLPSTARMAQVVSRAVQVHGSRVVEQFGGLY